MQGCVPEIRCRGLRFKLAFTCKLTSELLDKARLGGFFLLQMIESKDKRSLKRQNWNMKKRYNATSSSSGGHRHSAGFLLHLFLLILCSCSTVNGASAKGCTWGLLGPSRFTIGSLSGFPAVITH